MRKILVEEMGMKLGEVFQIVKTAGSDFIADDAPRLGAALSYYTIFSLSPLLLLVIGMASLWYNSKVPNPTPTPEVQQVQRVDPSASTAVATTAPTTSTNAAPSEAQQAIFGQIEGLIGKQGAESLQAMMINNGKKSGGIIATVIAAITLIFGATGAFAQLQAALNQIWEVKPKPGQGIKGFIKTRVLSLTMVLVIGFLLMVSLVLSAGVAVLSKFMGHYLPGMEALWHVVTFALSFGVITVLFAMMFKLLPDAKIPWREVWFGAAVTAMLFTIGKFALGLYLGRSAVTSSFGAAGSLVLILLWVYYSSQILFFGAEITQVHAAKRGARIEPKEHAMWLSECEKPAGTKAKEPEKSKAREDYAPTLQPVGVGRAAATSHGKDGPIPVGSSGFSSVLETKAFSALILALAVIPLGTRGKKIVEARSKRDHSVT